MKKFYLLIFILYFFTGVAKVQAAWPSPGTYTIGATGADFTTITSAVTSLVSLGTLSGAYIFEFKSNYSSASETFPINIPASIGTSVGNTVTFRPQLGVTTSITSSNKFGTLKLNGAKYIYFDGRAGGVGTSKNLTIENTDNTTYTTTTSGITSSTTVTVASTSNFAVGMFVEYLSGGTPTASGYFGPNDTITSIINSTQFTVSAAPVISVASSATITVGGTPAAIIFVNGATKNSIKYCTLKSADQNITSGTVFFATTAGISSGGNNYNSIAYNDIADASTSTPLIGIYAEAFVTSGYYNNADTITYNNIYNYYKNASSYTSTGALLRCSSNWEVSYNSFYQTTSRAQGFSSTTSQAINITGLLDPTIFVSNTNIGNNNLVKGNYIGGTASNAGGSALTYTGSGAFVGIGMWAGTSVKTILDGNIIQNISFTSNSNVTPRGIAIFVGSVDCKNNLLGSQSISNSIQLFINGSTVNNIASMINAGSGLPTSGTVNITNNIISGIEVNSTSNLPTFRGISFTSNPTSYTVSNNLISNISSTTNIALRGIWTASHSSSNTISYNTISNMTSTSTGTTAEIVGIWTNNLNSASVTNTGDYMIKGNNINNLSVKSTNTTNICLAAIKITSLGTATTILQDTIYALRNTNASATGTSNIGVYISSASTSGGTLEKNIIYDITNIATNALIRGYSTLGGNWSASNNMISLSNSSNNNACSIIGIHDASAATGTRNYYFNSIYIGGNGGGDVTTLASAALFNNCAASGYNTTVKNNLLIITRYNASGHYYAVANNTNTISGLTIDNNILNSSSTNSVALYGTSYGGTNDKTFLSWQSIAGESSSHSAQFIPFMDTANGNLHINTSNATLAANAYLSYIESWGAVISGTAVDIDNDFRPGPSGSTRGGATAPDIGADEVDLTYTGDDTWTGSVSDVWTNASNWTAGVPNSSTKVAIPVVATTYPIITNSVNAKNIITGVGSSVSINSTGTLSIAGTFENNSTLTNNGTINFNGSSAQTFSGTGTIAAMNNLTVNNAAGLTISKSFSITGTLTPTSGVITLNNDTITVKSTSSATASIGVVGGSFNYTGNGKFIIERYIPAHRAWRLLTSPVTGTSGQGINASWQEGATPKSPMGAEPTTSIYNPNPGYGTHISGGSTANGFDQNTTGNASMKYYNGTSWQNVTSSLYTTKVTDQQGYMLFVRGSRASDLSQGQYQVADNTTLRSSGQLKTGTVNIPVSGNTIVANPYAAAINFHTVAQASSFSGDSYYLWDPALTGSYNVGAWVTFSYNGGSYDRTIIDSLPINSYPGSISQNGVIESGAAFMVTTATGNLIFNENAKTTGVNNAMFRPVKTRVNLLAENNDGTISTNDGILVTYADDASNVVDEKDAPKVTNFNESFSSRRDGKLIAIERRKTIDETDTIFFNLANVQLKNYQFEIATSQMQRDNLAAFLEDNYLNSVIPVSLLDTTRIKFSFNTNPASYNKERFKLVFKPSVKFLNISADVQNSDIILHWAVDGEFNLKEYTIERSTDSINYSPITTIASGNDTDQTVSYNFIDNNIKTGAVYFYRIKNVSKAGVIAHSHAIKIAVLKNSPDLFVFPNPIRNNNIGLQLNGKASGMYLINITTLKGENVYSEVINYQSGSSIYINPGKNLHNGVYLLTLTDSDKKNYTVKIVIVS